MIDRDKHIKEILAKYGEDFETNTWLLPGGKSRAILHPCVERMAARAGIHFKPPQILSSAPDNVVIIVTGNQPDGAEIWSFGEAAPKNNKNAYPYSMAEKRGKGRVALKLLGLHGLLHDETETFVEDDKPKSARQAKKDGDWERLTGDLSVKEPTIPALLLWPAVERHTITRLRSDWQEELAEKWSQLFEKALADECLNLAEIKAFGLEYGQAIELMPAAFTTACDRIVLAAKEHHKRQLAEASHDRS